MNRQSDGPTCLSLGYARRIFQWTVVLSLALIYWCVTPGAAARSMTDDEIETAVDSRLMRDNPAQAYGIDVRSKDGVVTLVGTVDNLLAAERAGRIASTIKGVRAVVNDLIIVSLKRPDARILEDVEKALAFGAGIDAAEIGVTVQDAEVTLTGTVDSWQQKTLAGRTAKGVRGVHGLFNRLEVKPSARRPDTEIETELRRLLEWDVWIESSGIDVAVADGRVRLSGTVASLAEKNRAAEKAWITGVVAVDASGLTIDWKSHRKHLRSVPPVDYSDEEIAQAITTAFKYDPRVPETKIDVRVANGVVIVKGIVDLLQQADAIQQDARNTAGVWMVKNLVKVRPALTPYSNPMMDADRRVAEDVRLALLLDPEIDQDDVTVTVNSHLVELEGRVRSRSARIRAARVTSRVRGVAQVVNNLQVVRPRHRLPRPDWEIKHDIESELRWSPFVDDEEITVAVTDGVAVLNGVVEDLRARRAATLNALQGGATRVSNHLKVRRGPDFLRP